MGLKLPAILNWNACRAEPKNLIISTAARENSYVLSFGRDVPKALAFYGTGQ
jgi:hypothetical protein